MNTRMIKVRNIALALGLPIVALNEVEGTNLIRLAIPNHIMTSSHERRMRMDGIRIREYFATTGGIAVMKLLVN